MIVTNRLVFVHCPHTGGNSVRALIRSSGCPIVHESEDPHCDFATVERQRWNQGRQCFTLVRHPAFWLRSHFYFVKRGGTAWIDDLSSLIAHCDHVVQFLERVSRQCPGVVEKTFRSYTTGTSLYVGHTEELTSCLFPLLRREEEFDPVLFWERAQFLPANASNEVDKIPSNVMHAIMASETHYCRLWGYL